jgi:hypothetical protein
MEVPVGIVTEDCSETGVAPSQYFTGETTVGAAGIVEMVTVTVSS